LEFSNNIDTPFYLKDEDKILIERYSNLKLEEIKLKYNLKDHFDFKFPLSVTTKNLVHYKKEININETNYKNFIIEANIEYNKLNKIGHSNYEIHTLEQIRCLGGIIIAYLKNDNEINYCSFRQENDAINFIDEKLKNNINCCYIQSNYRIAGLKDLFQTFNSEITITLNIEDDPSDFLFLFDTGAQITTINQCIIDKFELLALGSATLVNSLGNQTVNYYHINLQLTGCDDYIKRIRVIGPYHNLFGFNLINKYNIIINNGVISNCLPCS